MIIMSALMCLTMNIYYESRGEPMLGQRAVALTTWNRAGHDKDKVCDTVFKDKQFSWTNGKIEKLGYGYKFNAEKPKDKAALELAREAAFLTIEGRMYDFTKGADHYHEKSVKPFWSKSMTELTKVGRHIFYKA